MVNAMANGIWKKALKQLVSSVTAVLIVQFSDPSSVVFSKQWFAHLGYAICILTVFNEAKYWKDWADNANGKGESDGKT